MKSHTVTENRRLRGSVQTAKKWSIQSGNTAQNVDYIWGRRKMIKAKTIDGLIFVLEKKGLRTIKGQITVRATRNELGQSISLTDEKNGVMFEIPVEPVSDMIEVKE